MSEPLPFRTEDEVRMYRFLCELIVNHPSVWDRFVADVDVKSYKHKGVSAPVKQLFGRFLNRFREASKTVALKEYTYWRKS